MRWILFLLFSLSVSASSIGPSVDKIKSMKLDGKNYILSLTNFGKEIVISDENAVVPCLENAVKAEMEVLVIIVSDIPIITSCKLYSSSMPIYKPGKRKNERDSPTTKPVNKKN